VSAAREAVAEALAALQDRDLGAAEECLDRALNLLAGEAPLPNHVRLGYSFPASREAVDYLLAQRITGPNDGGPAGRSEWRWFWIGADLICGFYPQGEIGFTGTEVLRDQDDRLAERSRTRHEVTIPLEDLREANE
jgi:hypothetical protein